MTKVARPNRQEAVRPRLTFQPFLRMPMIVGREPALLIFISDHLPSVLRRGHPAPPIAAVTSGHVPEARALSPAALSEQGSFSQLNLANQLLTAQTPSTGASLGTQRVSIMGEI